MYPSLLPVSGLRVLYDLSRPDGHRVKDICIQAEPGSGRFERLREDKVYRLVVTTFLIKGGDGYSIIRKNALKIYISGAYLQIAPWVVALSGQTLCVCRPKLWLCLQYLKQVLMEVFLIIDSTFIVITHPVQVFHGAPQNIITLLRAVCSIIQSLPGFFIY